MASGPQIVARFVADTSKLTSEVDNATRTTGSKLSSWAKGAAIAVGGAFAVGKIVEFGKAAADAAAADAEAQAQLAAALKNTTGATDAQVAAAEEYIANLSKQAAIADDELRPAMATLARAFGNTEDAQAALTLATDVAAGTGKDVSAVTDAMAKAAMGNTAALKKMGVQVKNADGSAKSLDEIMADLAQTFEGQAAIAADSTAGQMRNAQIQMAELQETIGAKLLPVLGALAGFFVDTLIPAVAGFVEFLSTHKEIVLAVLIGFATTVGAVLVPAFIAWATAAGAAAVATIAANAPIIAIGAVVAGVALLIIKNWDNIRAVTEKVWNAILGAIRFVFDWLKNNWPLVLAIITGPIGAAVYIVVRYWDQIKAAAVAVYNWLRDAWQAVSGFVTAPITAAKEVISTAFAAIKTAATETYDWIKDKFDAIAGAISAVVGSVRSAAESVANAIKAPINAVIGLWNGLEFRIPEFTLPEFDTHIPGVGKVGGGRVGGMTIGFPDLPYLARGAVLTSPTAFIGGEAGTELVTPETLLRQIIGEEAGGNTYVLNMQPRTADSADIAYAFRRLEMLAGV